MKKRILTGDRPTGRLHLGHYVGTLANRVLLQDEYDCFFIIADLHTLTTRPQKEHIAELPENIREMVLDYLSVGIDAQRSTIYLQSAVPELYALNLMLAMLVTVPRLSRMPSLKEMARNADLSEMPFGLLGYPVLQAADILLPRAHLVPVGKENVAHVEVTREIARRFNSMYGPVFPEPEALVGDVPSLIGTDGKSRMSKSAGNAIFLSDSPEAVARKVSAAYTDPARIRADIPGKVEGNPVFAYLDAFDFNAAEVAELKERYRAGKVGDREVKDRLTRALNEFLDPIREKRASFTAHKGLVEGILAAGVERMRKEARQTLSAVHNAMGITSLWRTLGIDDR
jgi:tryptophanyl-tRNA synthetase